MVTRAGTSDSVFRDIFATADECYCAAFEEGLARLSQVVEQAAARGGSWFERVRSGVVGLLGFFDDEPQWARLLVLDAPVAGAVALACDQRLLGVLTRLLDGARAAAPPQPSPASALTAELVAGGVFCVIRSRIRERDGEPAVELAPSLVSFIDVHYGVSAATAGLSGADEHTPARAVSRAVELPVRATHRTTQVLRAIARAPCSNNREIAQAAGLADEGQTSKLLARLARRGVIENVGVGAARGEPNAWLLTAEGRRSVELLGEGSGERTSRRTTPTVGGGM